MKRIVPSLREARNGMAALEVVVVMVVLLVFTVGMYVLARDCFVRLYHYVSTNVGGPYL